MIGKYVTTLLLVCYTKLVTEANYVESNLSFE